MIMMCSSCGWPIAEDDPLCHRCGARHCPKSEEEETVCILDLNGHGIPEALGDLIQPQKDEKWVGAWRCRSFDEERAAEEQHRSTMVGPNGPILSFSFGGESKLDGLIFLTNRRLLFFKEDYRFEGFVRTNDILRSLIYSIDLSAVAGLQVCDEALIILVKRNEVNLRKVKLSRMVGTTADLLAKAESISPSRAMHNLQLLIDLYNKEMDEERARGRVQVLIDFSFLRGTLEKGGVVLQSTKCPNCGGTVNLPETGTSVKCAYCGSDLKAYDVLERLRAIIGDIKD